MIIVSPSDAKATLLLTSVSAQDSAVYEVAARPVEHRNRINTMAGRIRTTGFSQEIRATKLTPFVNGLAGFLKNRGYWLIARSSLFHHSSPRISRPTSFEAVVPWQSPYQSSRI